MAKGDVTPLTFTTEIDPVTHVRVVRLTPQDRIFHRNYFYQKCFLQGGTQLLFERTAKRALRKHAPMK